MALNFSDILQTNNADALLVNTNDEFLSEFTARENNMLHAVTGFTGSNGIALLTKNKKLFFTDGRYTLQAKNEIPSDFKILHINAFEDIFKEIGLKKILLDANRFSAEFCLSLVKKNPGIIFINWVHDLVEPFQNKSGHYELPEVLVGESSESKIAKIRKHLVEQNAECYYITDCQNICWILNIRGEDEEFTPIYKTHLIITKNTVEFAFTGQDLMFERILVDNRITFATYNQIKGHKIFDGFITELKAVKNTAEIEGIKNANKIDSRILTRFLTNLENRYYGLTELSIGKELLSLRKQNPYFVSPSFLTICGYNANSAIIHYNADDRNTKTVSDGILLIDSGGQYCDISAKEQILGTTDVTRTIYLGAEPPQEYKKVFTLVLKGHIALATAEFPANTRGKDLDILARKPLIDAGYNYDHGTGHGVGAFLSVHESGAGISPRAEGILKEGMLISNEPGCYIEGKFGIRIENLILVIKKPNGLLGFETITFIPIQEKSVDFEMLDSKEKQWLESYNNTAKTNCSLSERY